MLKMTVDMAGLGRFVEYRQGVVGIQQREIAEKLERPPNWVSNLVRGKLKYLPDPDEMERLASVLRCGLGELLEAAGYKLSGDPITGEEDWSGPSSQELAQRLRYIADHVERGHNESP